MKTDHIHEQGSGQMNEDQILIGKTIFGVFDGATSLNKYIDDQGNTGGFLASLTAKEVFAKNNNDLVNLAKEANKLIAEKMKTSGVDTSDKTNLWATSIAAIRMEGQEFEWLTLSDSVIIVIHKDGNYELLGEFHDHDEGTIKLWQKYADQKAENIREKLADVIIENRRDMNIKYGVLNGEPEFINFIEHGKKSLENVAHIIIFSDGFLIPTKNAGEEDWDTLVKLYKEGGLRKIRDLVRERERNDTKMWEYPRLKPSDDIGAVAIEL